ncbi:MAG: hypothetical protein Q9226_004828 [Calogaya cf. arnoldii]
MAVLWNRPQWGPRLRQNKRRNSVAPTSDKSIKFSVVSTSTPSQTTQLSTSSTSSTSYPAPANASSTPITRGPSSVVPASQGTTSFNLDARAGISVCMILGLVIIALLLILLLYLMIKTHRRGNEQTQPTIVGSSHVYNHATEKPELGNAEKRQYAPHESSQQLHPVYEMPAERWDSELESSQTLHELSNARPINKDVSTLQ